MSTPSSRLLALSLCLLATDCPAQSQLEKVTREPDAYNTWKLALTAGTATDPNGITTPKDFRVELIRSALPEEDSWVALAFDPEGRVTIAREKKGLLRMTLGANSVEKVEVIDDTLLECRGLLYANGALYANANNSKVFVRLRDTDGDGLFETRDDLLRTEGGVGHGRNHVKLGPDRMLYLVHGNNVVAPASVAPESPLRNFRDDKLIPCPWDPQMFDGDVKLPAGHILRGDPDGKQWTLLAGGLRNPLDIAFNEEGEMFTFDADMEWDTGTPWYRPCRVNHIISGADFGWRRGTSKWPEYYPDSGPTVINIGLASPTAVEFGTKSNFPGKWKRALYICDWSYGRIIAVHLQPKGSTYSATAKTFVLGKPLNVTDLAFAPDGTMYFVTGGRRTQSGLYRVKFVGERGDEKPASPDPTAAAARKIRRDLEALHGRPRAGAVDKIWPHLSSEDLGIRHAARVALEWQDVAEWAERALREPNGNACLTALMALARSGTPEHRDSLLQRLNSLDFNQPEEEQQILAARTYQLAFIRLGPADGEVAEACTARLSALYPAKSWQVTHLLCELLAYLKAPDFLDKTMALLAKATRSEDLLHYLFHLRLVETGWSLDQRRAWFEALNRAETLEGARDYQRSIKMLRAEMLEKLTPGEQDAVAPLLAEAAAAITMPVSTGPQVLVKEWKVEDLLPALDRVGRGRSFDAGKQAFAGAQCVLCHRMGRSGGLVGPDLTAVASRFSRKDMLDSIINPSRVIDEKFLSTVITLKNSTQIIGGIESEDDQKVQIRPSPVIPNTITVEKSEIVSREPSPHSPMPPGLLNVLTQNQILDLLAYLESGGDPEHPLFAKK